jgi:hypothetical protein
MDFLGHGLGPGISSLPPRVQAITAFSQPITVWQLQAFLGLCNFYRKILLAAARLIWPLTLVLCGSAEFGRWCGPLRWQPPSRRQGGVSPLQQSWTIQQQGAELALVTDTSATHVGAVIQQRQPGQGWRPLRFFLSQLVKAQVDYIAFDRELFAVVAAIKHFHYMLDGRSVVVFTDHELLVGVLGRCSDS